MQYRRQYLITWTMFNVWFYPQWKRHDFWHQVNIAPMEKAGFYERFLLQVVTVMVKDEKNTIKR